MKKLQILALCLTVIYVNIAAIDHYYATSADKEFFGKLIRLIKSIYQHDAQNTKQIAVFNLGFTQAQRKELKKFNKVVVYEIEKRHPALLTHFKTSPHGRMVRGWFAWKPIAIKQALDLFPYVLYLDAGLQVLKPLDHIFSYIQQQGYFLVSAGAHNIIDRITKPVLQKIVWSKTQTERQLLNNPKTYMISAGIQGLSRNYYDCYVKHVYDHASDLLLFADDGSAKMGFGAGRHDQTLFSIYAHLAGMQQFGQGWNRLAVDGVQIPFHMHWDPKQLNEHSCLLY